MQALILAGGPGTGPSAAAPDLPIPLMPVGGAPFIHFLFRRLKAQGFTEVILAAGREAGMFAELLGDGSRFGLSLIYCGEERPLGTGGAVRNALPLVKGDWLLVLNGDTYFDLDYATLLRFHRKWGGLATLALKHRQDTAGYGTVELTRLPPSAAVAPGARSGKGGEGKEPAAGAQAQETYRVAAFREKGGRKEREGFINGGVYVFSRELVGRIPPGPRSLEAEVLPGLAGEGTVYGLPFGGRFIDAGAPAGYCFARENPEQLVDRPKHRALFLDRDGVINEDLGYVHRKEDVRLIERTIGLIQKANRLGWKVVVATNQAGVARGFYTEEDVGKLHQWLREELAGRGARIDGFFYCPHHPEGAEERYKKVCLCRKPQPGLILRAAEEMGLCVEKSIMVGDRETDKILLPYLKTFLLNRGRRTVR